MRNVIKLIVLVSILSLFSCETHSPEDNLELEIIEQLNEEYATDPQEDLEPGGSGGADNSEREEF